MKRSELHVGDELYHAHPGDWRDHRMGARVRVKATEPHVYKPGKGVVQVSSGTGVLVEVFHPHLHTWHRQVVQLGHLRGPWDEVERKLRAIQEVDDEIRRQQREKASENRARIDAIVKRATAAGFPCEPTSTWNDNDNLTIGSDALVRLLDAAHVPQCETEGNEHGK